MHNCLTIGNCIRAYPLQDKSKSKLLLGNQHMVRSGLSATQPSLPTLYSGVSTEVPDTDAGTGREDVLSSRDRVSHESKGSGRPYFAILTKQQLWHIKFVPQLENQIVLLVQKLSWRI